ncbi:MAG: CPBP family intramembrane metalloprotease [Propionibacteriales bacterium]|nr:CPBP family intramembrane metalloprotease [Propionibacteriales bacterium]
MTPSVETSVSVAMIVLALGAGVFGVRARRRGDLLMGLGVRGSVRDLATGVGLGTLAILVIEGVFLLLDVIEVRAVRPEAETVLGGLIVLLALAAYEELLFRVLLIAGIRALTGSTRWAVVVAVAVTLANHAFTDGVTALSLISAGLGGLTYTVAYVMSGRWWLPLGLHVAWNVVQGPVLGLPVSGTIVGPGPVLAQHTVGPDWLTGGAYGAEGGVVAITVRLVLLAGVVLICRRRAPQRW